MPLDLELLANNPMDQDILQGTQQTPGSSGTFYLLIQIIIPLRKVWTIPLTVLLSLPIPVEASLLEAVEAQVAAVPVAFNAFKIAL